MLSFKELIEESKRTGCTCWTGYKKVPGTKPCESGSCIKESERGLWDNIHAKQERIKAGSGEKMRKPGSKGAPTAAALKASQSEAANPAQQAAIAIAMKKSGKKPQNEELDESINPSEIAQNPKMYSKEDSIKAYYHKKTSSEDKESLASHLDRLHGTRQWRKPVKEEVEAQFDLIEQMVMAIAEQHNLDPEMVWEKFEDVSDEELFEAAVDAKGYKSSTGGLTQKGRDHYNNTEGGNLKAPVTTPPSKLKAGSKAANRRKSFCARMSGVDGPMKKPNGEPTRKALALRKWNC
jgi:hypothetical protein